MASDNAYDYAQLFYSNTEGILTSEGYNYSLVDFFVHIPFPFESMSCNNSYLLLRIVHF